MAEYAYLTSAKEPSAREQRVLMSAKRNLPFAWAMLFVESDRTADDAWVFATRASVARQRAKKRFARIRDLSGPKLIAVFDRFLEYLARVPEDWLVLDARELVYDGGDWLAPILESAASLDDRRERPRDLDLDEWEIGEDIDDDDSARFEIQGSGAEATYRMFGTVDDGDDAWLRPPEPSDAARMEAVVAAMAGYTLLGAPTETGDDVRMTFTHPAHRGVVFRVVIADDAIYKLSAHRSPTTAAENWDRCELDFGSLDGADRLSAWAAHVAAQLSLLRFPTEQDWIEARRWWLTPGGLEFGARMPTYEADAEALRASVIERLTRFVVDFVASDAPWASPDLGPLGSLVMQRVMDPAWEPHVLAWRTPERGDTTWRTPLPTYLLPPMTQIAIVDAVLAEQASALSSPEGWRIDWSPYASSTHVPNRESLIIRSDRIEPERFTAGFAAARTRTFEESAATLVFRGANLLIVAADGARVSFQFPVPADVGPHTPIFVSGWWTAKSGDRFASLLRLGDRVFHFDNDRKLITPPQGRP